MYEVVCGLLAWRAEVHHGGNGLLAGGLPDGGVPLLPLALVVRLVAGIEQQTRQRGHRPCWRRSRCQVAGLTGGRMRLRRLAQYPARAGSSGDARPATRVCLTIFVQENRRR